MLEAAKSALEKAGFTIESLHSVDEVIDQLCDEHEDRMREKDLKIEWLQECIDKRNEFDKKYGEQP